MAGEVFFCAARYTAVTVTALNQFGTTMKRVLDIAIASVLGAVLGAIFTPQFPRDILSVNSLHAKQILVKGSEGYVSIDGDHGISLNREDYASAMLWFREPGTGIPGKGGPVLWISGKEPQAFKASPSGQEIVHFKRDEKDGR